MDVSPSAHQDVNLNGEMSAPVKALALPPPRGKRKKRARRKGTREEKLEKTEDAKDDATSTREAVQVGLSTKGSLAKDKKSPKSRSEGLALILRKKHQQMNDQHQHHNWEQQGHQQQGQQIMGESKQNQADLVSHHEIEMVSIGSSTSASIQEVWDPKDDISKKTGQARKRLLVIASFIGLVLLGFIWMFLQITSAGGDPIIVDCQRIGNLLPIALFYFIGFFCVAMLFQPVQHSDTSIRHRSQFAKLTFLSVCLITTGGIAIGYPQGLCDQNCTCGACSIRAEGKLDLPQDPIQRIGENPTTANCSTRHSIYQKSKKKKEAEICASDGVELPQVCGIRKPSERKSIPYFAAELDSDVSVSSINKVKALLDILPTTLQAESSGVAIEESSSLLMNIKADDECSRREDYNCQKIKEEMNLHGDTFWQITYGINVLLPSMCDLFFGFCDESNVPKYSCPDSFCCQMCNLMMTTVACSPMETSMTIQEKIEDEFGFKVNDFTRKLESYTDYAKRSFIGDDFFVTNSVDNHRHWLINTTLSLMSTPISETTWESCMGNCIDTTLSRAKSTRAGKGVAPQYSAECLSREKRSWIPAKRKSVPSEAHLHGPTQSANSSCDCDMPARQWCTSVSVWQCISIFGAAAVIGTQTWIAWTVDLEEWQIHCNEHSRESWSFCNVRWWRFRHLKCCCTGQQIYSGFASSALVGLLYTQLSTILSGTSGTSCSNREVSMQLVTEEKEEEDKNKFIMLSWVILYFVMLWIIMFMLMVPIISEKLRMIMQTAKPESSAGKLRTEEAQQQHRRLQQSSGSIQVFRCLRLCKSVKLAYENAFSLKKGQYYFYTRLVSESIETGTQILQLTSFAHTRPYTWIIFISGALMFNSVAIIAPFLLGICFRISDRGVRIIFATIDSILDSWYLLVAIYFSEADNFGDSNIWWISVLGVLIPVVSLTLRQRSIRGALVDRTRGSLKGEERTKADRADRNTRVQFKGSSAAPKNPEMSTTSSGGTGNRAMIFLSLPIAVISLFVGVLFQHEANKGSAACRQMLGDTLWSGSSPQLVIAAQDASGGSWMPRGHCNFMSINRIVSSANAPGGPEALVRLPAEVAQLKHLEALILSGHNIASNGVPAAVLDSNILPELTVLQFGKRSPVRRNLNLENSVDLVEFPGHILRFMTDLESLSLRGTRISSLPSDECLSRLNKLRSLDVSDTDISYLPPSMLLESTQIEMMNISGTPVSFALDWSDQNLGDIPLNARHWQKMAAALPMLKFLNLSGNSLTKISGMNLSAWPLLESFDISRNPNLEYKAKDGFSWWKIFSEHANLATNATFIGLANAGLGSEHAMLGTNAKSMTIPLTCYQLRWMARNMVLPPRSRVEVIANSKYDWYYSWATAKRNNFHCNCSHGTECSYVDKAIYQLLLNLAPTMKSLVLFEDIFSPGFKTSLHQILNVLDETFVSLIWHKGHIEGSISSAPFDRFKNLHTLSLHENNLTGTLSGPIFMCSKLRELGLLRNRVSGIIPTKISSLTDLTRLDLGANNLEGHLPDELFTLKQLVHLSLDNNDLEGPIPPQISTLARLDALSLGNNAFFGPFPSATFALKLLTKLNLDNNALHGGVPDDISHLENLMHLNLDSNNLNGTIPKGLSALKALRELDLSSNSFVGNIPVELSQLVLLTKLSLEKNCFAGMIPTSLSRLNKLKTLRLGDNPFLHGEFSSEIIDNMASLTLLTLPKIMTVREQVGHLCLNANNYSYGKCADNSL